MDYTIAETYTLPSRGKIYSCNVSPQVKLRSMTVEEEMQRLSHSDLQYKVMCDVIDSCIVDDIGISAYDMHIGDYQFLLHKLRVVTYGSSYATGSVCPICGRYNKTNLNLDEIGVHSLDTEEDVENFKKLFELELPQSKKKVVLKFQTARDMDEVASEVKDFMQRNPDSNTNIEYLYTLRHLIETVDGKRVNKLAMDMFLKKLPMRDVNAVLKRATKINNEVGIDQNIKNVCSNPKCGAKYASTFRITSEFFGPSDDI